MSAQMHPAMIVFLRNVVELIICIPVLFFHSKEIKEKFFSKMLWLRGLMSQLASTCWFIGVSKVSLPSAMAFSFSTPLFTTITAIIFLKESISYRRSAALIIGFIGVLVILKPFSGEGVANIAPYGWVFSTVLLWAFANILIKKLSDSLASFVIIFYMSLIMTIFSIPLAFFYWKTPTLSQLPLILLAAISTLLWQWCLIKAFNKSQVTILQPFEFSKLIFACLIGYFLFDEVLDIYSWLGVLLVIASSSYVTWREHKIKQGLNTSKPLT
jgi:drug/metabolite transporter (DMT)-like permease